MSVSNNSLRPRQNNYFQNNSRQQPNFVAEELHQADCSQLNNSISSNNLEHENTHNSQNSSNSNSNQINFHRALPEKGIP